MVTKDGSAGAGGAGAVGGGRLLTTRQVAEWLGVGHQTLERWRGRGEGPPFVRLPGRAVRYRGEDVQAFVDAGAAPGLG